jgi:hypothetical protein
MMILAEHEARIEEMINAYKTLVGRTDLKRPLGRPRRRCEDNIRMHLREKAFEVVHCMYLARDRYQWWALVHKIMNLSVS